jgi:hypothetical protein
MNFSSIMQTVVRKNRAIWCRCLKSSTQLYGTKFVLESKTVSKL